MRLIKADYKIIDQLEGLEGIYKQIELAGRTCYKSEDKITKDSAKKFVKRMIASNHGAMLEHGTVYLKYPGGGLFNNIQDHNYSDYVNNPYSKVKLILEQAHPEDLLPIAYAYITTNLRVIIENGWINDLRYICEPTEYHEKRVTVKFTSDIGVNREANRHRTHSPGEESTRYCNYSKDKFNNSLSIIIPEEIPMDKSIGCLKKWTDNSMDGDSPLKMMCCSLFCERFDKFGIVDTWLFANLACEWSYMHLIELGWTPQQARRVLPLDTKAELVHTAFVSDWKHFFDLRVDGTTGAPHPDMKKLMEPLKSEFINRGLL